MTQIAIELKPYDLEQIIRQMNFKEQKELEQKLWAIRMDNFIAKIRANAKKNKITQKQINQACEKARQEFYDKRNR